MQTALWRRKNRISSFYDSRRVYFVGKSRNTERGGETVREPSNNPRTRSLFASSI